jgi:hypothetical protein
MRHDLSARLAVARNHSADALGGLAGNLVE